MGVLAAGCADPARSVAPNATPSLLTEGTITYTTDGPPPAPEPLRLLIGTAMLKPYYYPSQTLDQAYQDATLDCDKAALLIGAALDAYATIGSSQLAPPAGTTWEAAVQAVVADLGTRCKLSVPKDALVPNAIVRWVKASAGAQLKSPDELVALNIPAGAMGGDALVVVTRDPTGVIDGTSLPKWGPAYRVSTYPATSLSTAAARSTVEFFFVGSSPTLVRPPSSIENYLAIVVGAGSGSANTGGTAVITRPEYCAVLSGRIGRWGGASFLKTLAPTVTAPTAADIALGGFGVAFLSDSAGTTGSGCGQAPPGFASEEGADVAPLATGTAAFDVQAPGIAVATADPNAYGTFGVVQIYDPARSAEVRAGLTATICGRVATLKNMTGRDVVAVIDPVNRATGRWSGWKLPVLVPPGGATATLPLTSGDDKAGEVQLSYGPESLGHVGLWSGCQ
ncbi:hypothetical protein rosag_19480 [Roseisolibacter agri]|uniref:Uncharacterized protein n=2 Tax=Roseisolibacter agri TaxID=2014610 RepID=A0AA37V111_9BACT|nr:hypothetical protein rosag_19480 [Roseisolibacter agri]